MVSVSSSCSRSFYKYYSEMFESIFNITSLIVTLIFFVDSSKVAMRGIHERFCKGDWDFFLFFLKDVRDFSFFFFF